MLFGKLSAPSLRRVTVDRFPGLDRREGAAEGSCNQLENLWSGAYPALAACPTMGTVTKVEDPQAMTAGESLIWVAGRRVYVGGLAAGPALTEGTKRLVTMGAYLVIFPDKVWLNLRDTTQYGYLENIVTTAGEVSLSLCRADGSLWGEYTVSPTAPVEGREGDLWLDTSAGAVLRRYDGDVWDAAADVCVKLQAAGIGVGFAAGDGVTVSGCGEELLNGRHVLRQAEADAIILTGTIPGDRVETAPITVSRTVPDMDYVTECGNRLWGCKYGVVDGRAVNEIYACKLGDFRNWHCYEGLSTDSYAASRGSDGPFTAAVSYSGSVLFCKEHCIERLYPSATGGHSVVTLACPGVAAGCADSAVTVDGVLYYVGRGGVYAFDGSIPACVSAPLGAVDFTRAAAGAWQGCYYLSAEDGDWQLLVYDTRRHLWHRRAGFRALRFAFLHGELYALRDDGTVFALHGAEGEKAEPVRWYAESGALGLRDARHRYPMRLTLHLRLEKGSSVKAALRYDGAGQWYPQGTVTGRGGTEEVTLHLRPRRCGHVQLRLEGVGGCTVCAVSAVYAEGSDET